MTEGELEILAQMIVRQIKGQTDPLAARVEALEGKSGESLRWRGSFQATVNYVAGDIVLHSSRLWLAAFANSAEPGTDASWLPFSKGKTT